MDFKRSALTKAGDKLLKAFELADSFNKRKETLALDYNQKIGILKESLSVEYKRCIENSKSTGLFAMKRETVETVSYTHLTLPTKRIV